MLRVLSFSSMMLMTCGFVVIHHHQHGHYYRPHHDVTISQNRLHHGNEANIRTSPTSTTSSSTRTSYKIQPSNHKSSSSSSSAAAVYTCPTPWVSTQLSMTLSSSSSSSDSTTTTTSTNKNEELTDEQQGPAIGYSNSCLLPPSQIKPIVTLKRGTPQEKIINAFGMYTILVTLILNPIWALAMFLVERVYQAFPDMDPNRALYDQTGKLWSKAWLALTNSYPSMSGENIENVLNHSIGVHDDDDDDDDAGMDGPNTACLFVANHASWLDIPVLCTVLDPVFKFIAKGELSNVPCIGQQLTGGKHILIDRQDRKSQLRTFKEGVQWLQKGVPLMAFPEGKRSKDGRLDEFKGGIFSMALKAKVPIVPISISNTHAIMPSNALFPFQSGSGKLHVHIHEPICVEGRTEQELVELVREALLSRMPLEQHPLQTTSSENHVSSESEEESMGVDVKVTELQSTT